MCVGSFEKLNTLQLLQCLASRNLPCKEEVSSFEQKSESAMGSFYALCATHPSCLRPLLEQGLGNLQGHTALLHSPHSNDQNCLQSDTVLLPDDLKDKLAIIADYHWKTLECKMLENLSFRMDVESNDLSDATSVLQQAVDALKSRRLPPTCIKQLMDANLQACVELDGELNKEIAVQQILTHQERSLAHLDCAICTLRNVATCNLLPFNNALTPDQLCFVYSSPVESIEIRVSCDVFGVIGAITDIEVLENHPLLIDKSRISTNHADALFYHTLLTAGIQSLFPPDCFGSNGSPTDIMRLSIFLGRLAMATNDLALVAKQHAVSVDCVQLDRLLLSINMTKGNNDSCKIEVVYDLTDEFLLFSALPMDVKVVSEKNIEQQPEFAEAVSQALLVRGVVGSAMLLQEFCEYIQSYTTLSDSSCPESPTLDV